MVERPRIVIVGGGFAGLAAAFELRRADAEVIVIDRQNHHLFQPLLYQVATAALSPANIASPIRKILARQRNVQVIMANVDEVDLEERTITVVSERYLWDYLILAAGARTNYFGRAEWAEHAPGLKTIDEAIDIRRRFLLAFEQAEIEQDAAARRAALTFTIVGAGPTGVEMAGAIAEISRHTLKRDYRMVDTSSVRVILLDMAERVLPAFPPALSARAQRDLEALGVEVMLSTRVLDVDERGLTVERAGASQRIDSDNVVWAAGVRAASIGSRLGAETDRAGRVVVGDDLTVPGHPHVFVVGDLASRIDPRTRELVPGVAQGALQMGRFAGRVIARELGAIASGGPAPPRGTFIYRDKGMLATIGRNRAVARIGRFSLAGWPAFALWGAIHIFFLIEFRNRILTLLEWMWMYVFYERGVRLITGERVAPRVVKPPPDPRLAARDEARTRGAV